jgi:hypothetical protein
MVPQIGDIIVVKDPGATYIGYDMWARDHGLKQWAPQETPEKDKKYKVICLAAGNYAKDEAEGDQKRMGIESLENGKQYIFRRNTKYNDFEIINKIGTQLELDL